MQRPNSLIWLIDKGNQNQVNVLWHYNHSLQIVAIAMIVQARLENDFARRCGHYPALEGTESYEVWFVITLEMRKASTIKGHDMIA